MHGSAFPALLSVTLLLLGGGATVPAFPSTASAAGQAAFSFSLPDLEGKVVTSDSLIGGPAALIFWSTWSPRSAEVLEDFKRYTGDFASKGLRVVAVNVEGDNPSEAQKQQILDYAQRMELPFPVLLDQRLEVPSRYGIVAHPSVVLLDVSGKVVYKLAGYPIGLREELGDAIRALTGTSEEKPGATAEAGCAPGSAASHYYVMGKRMLEMGMREKARDCFRRASAGDPSFIEPAVFLARMALGEGNAAAAEEAVRGMDAEAVNRGDIRYILGFIMLLGGKGATAEKIFRGISERYPAEGWGWWGLGLVALSRGDAKLAAEHMEKGNALQRDNDEAQAFTERFLRQHWQKGESAPGEDRFMVIFPRLSEAVGIHRRLRRSSGNESSP